MLIPKSLTLSGIGRFVEPQTIDFTRLGSLTQVEGQNNNTGGSSGSAKSTIFKALDFLLGLNDISNGILQSRLTKEHMLVSGMFDWDGLPTKIERGKKLLIDVNGEVTTGSSKLTEEKLDQIIGMPRDLFRKILHKRQGEGGFFLQMGPSDVHKFLANCLALEKEQAKTLILDTRLDDLRTKENSAWNGLESSKIGLEATQDSIWILGPSPILEIAPEAVERLKMQFLGAQDTHTLVKASHKAEIEDLERSRPQIMIIPFDRSSIQALEIEISTIGIKIVNLEKIEQSRQSKTKDKISELQLKINDLNIAEKNRQYEIERKISDIVYDKTNTLIESNVGNEAKEEAIGLVEELRKVRLSMCPTCEQSWATDAAKAKETDILQKLQLCKKAVIAGMDAQNRFVAYEEQIKVLRSEGQPKAIPEIGILKEQIHSLQLESQPQAIPEVIELKLTTQFKIGQLALLRDGEANHQLTENNKSKIVLDQFAQRQTNLRAAHQHAIQIVQDAENKASSDLKAAENQIKSFEESKKRFEESFKKLKDQELSYQNQIDLNGKELEAIKEEIELATESKKAIKSYLSCSFEDALESIGDMATRLVRGIPNMATATIQFEGLKETKEGKVKEEINCLISMDGEIGIPVKSLSGGERSSIDLGIDLAVIQFIEERTGKGIDLFILDEPFTGLDSQCCEDAIEMLKNCTLGKRIFLVDHNPQVGQTIENKLLVVRDGLTSKIVQQ